MGWFHGRDGHCPDEQWPSGVEGDALAFGGWIAPALLVNEAQLAVIGVPGAGRVEMQGEVFGEAQHRGIRVRVIIERIALGASSERPESVRKLLVARLIGAVVGLFGLALTAVRALIRIVVGVGIVVVLHRPHNGDSQPATLQFSNPRNHVTTAAKRCRAAA